MQCGRSFEDAKSLAQHQSNKKHRNNGLKKEVKLADFKCYFCPRTFVSKMGREEHVHYKHQLRCFQCDTRFKSMAALQNHKKSGHQVMVDKIETLFEPVEERKESEDHLSTTLLNFSPPPPEVTAATTNHKKRGRSRRRTRSRNYNVLEPSKAVGTAAEQEHEGDSLELSNMKPQGTLLE